MHLARNHLSVAVHEKHASGHPGRTWPLFQAQEVDLSAAARTRSGHLAWLLVAAAVFSVAGCAGTGVQNLQQTATAFDDPPPRTIAVIVENDSPPPQEVNPIWFTGVPQALRDDYRARQLEAPQIVVSSLQDGLAKKLSERGLAVVPPGQPADLALHCSVKDVRLGSVAVRTVIGLGAGKALLGVHVDLIASKAGVDSTLLAFDTESTTGHSPGIAATPVPAGGAALGAALAGKALGTAGALRSGLPKETDETIDKIDDQLKAYFASRHWLYLEHE